MENKIRCQSCGMPLSESFGNLGTNKDDSHTFEYCAFCWKNGAFTDPNQTMDQMIQSSIENMTADLNMPNGKAAELANSFIPTLSRWRKS
ncbi:MAG: zinc ribbon domain-containing protein [Pyrinomonadaceae bacterium]|nr:zinc ribbon domain-containing protein [Pyrinomonadaceae bacterium]